MLPLINETRSPHTAQNIDRNWPCQNTRGRLQDTLAIK